MFELALPWALIVLPLPLLIWFLLPRATLQLSVALNVPFYQAIDSIVEEKKSTPMGRGEVRLLFLIWCLIILAASGPRWIGNPQPLIREGRNIMLVMDLSGSMELTDMLLHARPVSRLTVVKHAAEQFVRARFNDRIGLILFGTRAYLQTPLTYDHHSVLTRLEDATVGLAGQTTSIGDAIGLAVKRLQDVPDNGRVIILLTDGANNSGILSPMKAAELAKLDHIKLYTIGLGSESDPKVLNNLFLNGNSTVDLDEETLKNIADITGGRYFRATDTQSLSTVYDTINHLETVKHDQAIIRPQHDYYPWPLSLALLLFFYQLGKRTRIRLHFSAVEGLSKS